MCYVEEGMVDGAVLVHGSGLRGDSRQREQLCSLYRCYWSWAMKRFAEGSDVRGCWTLVNLLLRHRLFSVAMKGRLCKRV